MDDAGNRTVRDIQITVKSEVTFDIKLENDNGLDNADGVISSDSIRVKLDGAAGDKYTLKLYNAAGELVKTSDELLMGQGADYFEFTGLPEGEYRVVADVVDIAGNQAQVELPGITLDTTYDNFTVGLVDEFGASDDNVISSNKPTFKGQGEPGAEVHFQIDDFSETTRVTASGNWQFQLPTDLPDGQHQITIYSVDKAGNQTPSQTISFTVDTQAAEFDYVVEGVHENDGQQYLNNQSDKAVIQGTATENGKITISINNKEFVIDVKAGEPWEVDLGDLLNESISIPSLWKMSQEIRPPKKVTDC